MILLALAMAKAESPTWERALAHQTAHYEAPTASERATLRSVVRALAEGAQAGEFSPELVARAGAAGLALHRVDDVVYLEDEAGGDRGAGVLALRFGPLHDELVVQAPHATSDENTGAVAAAMFDLGGVRAVWVSTASRDAAATADPVASAHSWLSATTLGLADGLVDPLIVQIHGFGPSTTRADAVLSPGARHVDPDEWLEAYLHIGRGLTVRDVRGPSDVPSLAARKNVQGRILARRGLRFWHVELSASTRECLRVGTALRSSLRDHLLLLASAGKARG